MKTKLSLIFFLFLVLAVSSQNKNFDYLNKTKPNTKNELSIHFKNEIPFTLLKKINYPKNHNTLNVFFFINELGEIYKVNTSFKVSKQLYKYIKKALINYPIEKLNIKDLSPKNKYSFQIIASTVEYENIIYCSSIIVTEKLPVCTPCKDLNYYKDIETCIKGKIDKHFYNYIHFSLANRFKDKNYFTIKIDLAIDELGKLYIKKAKAPRIFLNGIKNAVDSFPQFKTPSFVNGTKVPHNYTFNVNFKKGAAPKYREPDNYDSISKTNSTNDFAKFIIARLDKKYIENSGLSRLNKKVSLNFELNKKGIPFNIRTNARSYSLDKKIINIFKEYPIEKLDLGNKSTLNNYFTTILTYNNGKTFVETNVKFAYEGAPVYSGCEKSNNIIEAKKCFSKGVQMHFSRKFDSRIAKKLKLSPGRKRILIGFKINTKGKITDINVRAPHPEIEDEVISVMKRLPKIEPGYQNGKAVNVKYNIPFTILVN
ncbi:MAG: energy transducer TonB [Polaribacter sp.]